MSRAELAGYVAHFQWRVLQDALAEATAAHWERRAEAFASVGTSRCDQVALACRRHAWLLRDTGLDAEARDLTAAAIAEQGRRVA